MNSYTRSGGSTCHKQSHIQTDPHISSFQRNSEIHVSLTILPEPASPPGMGGLRLCQS